MSIRPPTDIVMDVARAADPVKAEAAIRKLAGDGTLDGVTSFADFLDSKALGRAAASDIPGLSDARTRWAANTGSKALDKAHEGLEAVMLQNMLQAVLPKESKSTYGTGTSGTMWRSMMAEQLSHHLAKHGGLGIASHIFSQAAHKAAPFQMAPVVTAA